MKEQKEVYIVLDENEIIQKAFERKITFEKGRSIWETRTKNFDEEIDLETAISANLDFDDIQIGITKYENSVEVEEEKGA